MLTPAALDLRTTTLEWSLRWWDHERHLVWNPPASLDEHLPERSVHLVPQSAWLAYGMLGSDDAAERAEALAAIDALLGVQYDEPGTAFHGTFAIVAEAAHPPAEPTMWVDYDPNWRQFLGTTFALMLEDFADRIGAERAARIEHAIELAVWGEPDGRIPPSYANPALMRSWLDAWWGSRCSDDSLVARGEVLALAVVAAHDRHDAFDEFNSPTYYGVDLLALALWEQLPPSPLFAEHGRRLTDRLWDLSAAYYHPGLRNWCGPYTRSYHPDATRSVTLLALWIWATFGRDVAPLPTFATTDVDHCHDLMAGPVLARLAGAPRTVDRSDFTTFEAPRRLALTLPGHRQTTSILHHDLIIGCESSVIDWGGWIQPMLLTAHWLETAPADIGVLWLHAPHIVGATVSDRVVSLRTSGATTSDGREYATIALVARECTTTPTGFATAGVEVRVDGDGDVAIEIEVANGDGVNGATHLVTLTVPAGNPELVATLHLVVLNSPA